MITLNDYLYSGDTVFRILKKYSEDLKLAAEENQSEVDLLFPAADHGVVRAQ